MVWKLMGFGDRDRARDARAREARDCLRERRRSGHLAQALRLEDSDLVHKVFCAMVLSEAVYKQNDEEVIRFVQLTNGMLPWTLPANKLTELQFSSDWASQRCVVTESGGCLFVCFRGTKVNRDFITDLNVFFDPVFENYSNGEAGEKSAAGKPSKADTPCAHRGFLFRAKQVPILWFYKIAKTKGLKLIFTGHSLGGAVAALATIRLLRWLDLHGKKWDASNVSCISFAAPAMGNLALQKYATSQHWDDLIYNYTLQEDFVPILMQPQRLFRWTSKKNLLPSSKAVAAPPPLDLEGGEAGKGGSGAAGQNGGPPTAPGEDKPVSKLPAPPEGDTSKDLKRTGSGDARYIRQVVKFAVRLRRMVPIAGRGSGDSARVGNTFAYVGKQLTVLDSAVVPASLKNEVLREYKELSKEVPEGAEREQQGDAETSRRWNLVRWAVQSFESHRMYSYRDRILAACRLVPNVPDPLPVALTDTVLPRVELNFGTVRLCKPLADSSRRTNSASVHITLAGRNLLPCRNFQMEAQGRRIKVDKFFSSKLDRTRATTWTKMRLPESLSFWSKAFGDSEEVYQLLVRVQLNASLRWEDMVAAPLRAVCRSDFEEASLGLVVVPVHVRLSGRHFGHAHILRGLLTLHEDREATEAEAGALDLMNERWAGSPGPSRRNSLDGEDPEAFPKEERFQRIVNYSVLNTFDVLRNWVKRPLVTIEETSDTILFVDTVDRWETEGRVPAIPYQVKRAHDHGVESFLVLLRTQSAPLLSFAFGSSSGARGAAAAVDPEAIERRVAEAGFTKVVFLNQESSAAIVGASHDGLSPHALYATLARRGYRDVVKTLSRDSGLMDQVKHIHDALHFNLNASQLPSPLLHRKTMGGMGPV